MWILNIFLNLSLEHLHFTSIATLNGLPLFKAGRESVEIAQKGYEEAVRCVIQDTKEE